MTVKEALQSEPRLTIAQLMDKTGLPPSIIRREITKFLSRGLVREVVYVEYTPKGTR